jgi:fructose-specific component phosphotransferase system IIB-like protein
MKVLRVYWGCALTHAPEEYKGTMNRAISFIKNYHPQVQLLEFLGTTAGTSEDVYIQDIETNVASCNLFLNDVSCASLGLGFELASALLYYNKPVISFVHENIRLTRLLLGAAERHENYKILSYRDEAQLMQMIGNILYEKVQELNAE